MATTEIVSLALGVLGLGFGIYQTLSARSAKKIFKNNCKMRCRDATDKAQRLAENITQICTLINYGGLAKAASQDLNTLKVYAGLNAHVSAALDVAKDWVRFCLRLNEEHQDEFKEAAVSEDELQRLRDIKQCLREMDNVGDMEIEREKFDSPSITA
jgi:hypothetical protein